jgi:hypothetical protein
MDPLFAGHLIVEKLHAAEDFSVLIIHTVGFEHACKQ